MKAFFLLLVPCLVWQVVPAQIGKRLGERVKEKTTSKGEEKIDETLDKVFDGSIFKKKKKAENDDNDKKAGTSAKKKSSPPSGDDTDFSAYREFDFVPGATTLYFEDFATARLGQGAGNWTVTGKGEPAVTSLAGSTNRWLRTPKEGLSFPNSFNGLPDNCTIEFDMYADPKTMSEMMSGLKVVLVKKMENRSDYDQWFNTEPQIFIDIHPSGEGGSVNLGAKMEYNGNLTREQMTLHDSTYRDGWMPDEVNRVSISRKGKHITMYLNESKYIDLPNGLPKPGEYGLVFANNMWGDGTYITNLRIGGGGAATSRAINNELSIAKKFISRTIYFDVNSARIKPESWATLNEIANAINASQGNFLILGHTDSDGSEEANLALSIRRSASVKNALANEFGVNGNRLTTDGRGESEPVESNNTVAGKAQNRRVEFIQQ